MREERKPRRGKSDYDGERKEKSAKSNEASLKEWLPEMVMEVNSSNQ